MSTMIPGRPLTLPLRYLTGLATGATCWRGTGAAGRAMGLWNLSTALDPGTLTTSGSFSFDLSLLFFLRVNGDFFLLGDCDFDSFLPLLSFALLLLFTVTDFCVIAMVSWCGGSADAGLGDIGLGGV